MVRESCTDKVTFEQRTDRSKGASKVGNWGEDRRPRGKKYMFKEQKKPYFNPWHMHVLQDVS